MLLTTQYLEEADALADSIVLIDHGRTVATGTPSALKAQIGEQRVDVVAADTASLERLVRVLGGFEMKVSSDRRTISIPAPLEAVDLSAVTACLVTAGLSADEIALRRPTLDDAFLTLTGQAPAPRVPSSASTSPYGGERMSAVTALLPELLAGRTEPAGALRTRDQPAGRAQPTNDPSRAGEVERRHHPAPRVHAPLPVRVRFGHPHSRHSLPGLSAARTRRPGSCVRRHRRRRCDGDRLHERSHRPVPLLARDTPVGHHGTGHRTDDRADPRHDHHHRHRAAARLETTADPGQVRRARRPDPARPVRVHVVRSPVGHDRPQLGRHAGDRVRDRVPAVVPGRDVRAHRRHEGGAAGDRRMGSALGPGRLRPQHLPGHDHTRVMAAGSSRAGDDRLVRAHHRRMRAARVCGASGARRRHERRRLAGPQRARHDASPGTSSRDRAD